MNHTTYYVNTAEELATIPPNTTSLFIFYSLPDGVLPELPANLESLRCQHIRLRRLPQLPSTLKSLICINGELTELPALPASLEGLFCSHNRIRELPELPASLLQIQCNGNHLTELPALPASLLQIECNANRLTELPALPDNLEELHCTNNQLRNIPQLPDSLQLLLCENNQLTKISALSANLKVLECSNNQLTKIPTLPDSLGVLICNNNQLTKIPKLPRTLRMLNITGNNLNEPFLTFVMQYTNRVINLEELKKRVNQIYDYYKQGRNLTGLQLSGMNRMYEGFDRPRNPWTWKGSIPTNVKTLISGFLSNKVSGKPHVPLEVHLESLKRKVAGLPNLTKKEISNIIKLKNTKNTSRVPKNIVENYLRYKTRNSLKRNSNKWKRRTLKRILPTIAETSEENEALP